MIASTKAGDIPFVTFSLVNSVFIGVAVVISIGYIFAIFKKELKITEDTGIDRTTVTLLDEWSVVDSRRKLYLVSVVLAIVVVGLILSSSIGLSVGFVAITGAIIAIIVTKADIISVIHRIELDSILFFIGLFVLMNTLQISGVLEVLAQFMLQLSGGDPLILAIIIITIISILSAVVANIPITIALVEVIRILLADPEFASQTIFGFPVGGFLVVYSLVFCDF